MSWVGPFLLFMGTFGLLFWVMVALFWCGMQMGGRR